jgi:starvation-inducible outer membrane lipoprotein
MENYCEHLKTKRTWLVIPFILMLTGCAPAHMVLKQDNFDIKTVKPSDGKAALVIARTTSFGGAINFHTYIEQNIIGVTSVRTLT